MKIQKKYVLILISILLLGFIIRWGVIAYICTPNIVNYPTMDEMNYRELAVNILDHHVFATWTEGFYTTSTRAPIYPLMIASAYSLTNNRSYNIPKIANLCFDMCNILLIFVLAATLFRIKIGLIASAVYAIFGHASYFMAISSPHTLGLMLLLLSCIAIIHLKKSYWLSTIALSFFYTLLIHTRPVFLIASPAKSGSLFTSIAFFL